jgi:hypothetical protein
MMLKESPTRGSPNPLTSHGFHNLCLPAKAFGVPADNFLGSFFELNQSGGVSISERFEFRCSFRVGIEVLLAAGLNSDLQLASPPF